MHKELQLKSNTTLRLLIHALYIYHWLRLI